MKEFANKVAVITGAASGIGRALAMEAAARGMRLVLADVDDAGLKSLESDLAETSPRVATRHVDVSKADDVQALADMAFDDFGSVDLLFNNAGVLMTGMLWEHEISDYEWMFGVNIWGVVHGIRSFVPRMLAAGTESHVINTASIAGFLNAPVNSLYGTTKHAVIALSESLHYELAVVQASVKANVICPGPIATQIVDADRNRPEALKGAELDKAAEDFKDMLRQGIAANGMQPDVMARMTFDAIEEDRFWILPHKGMLEPLRDKVDGLLNETNPVFSPMVTFD